MKNRTQFQSQRACPDWGTNKTIGYRNHTKFKRVTSTDGDVTVKSKKRLQDKMYILKSLFSFYHKNLRIGQSKRYTISGLMIGHDLCKAIELLNILRLHPCIPKTKTNIN